ncbi:MAG: hypothetical protein N2259_00945 [Patescibacteria group bacterium]|nr:hypothetical protein [Patescibacteria group bacterium]
MVTHGKYGDDGCLQGLLELLEIPYTGSGVLSAALGMDKAMQRELMKAYGGINIPDYLVISQKEWQENKEKVREKIEKKFGWPVVTKPTREGSTIGVMLVKEFKDLEKAMNYALL